MLVQQFLKWYDTAPVTMRAEATGSLARAFLHGELDESEKQAAQTAMVLCLDDRSPVVRRALADALAGSPKAPYALIVALAHDQSDVAAPVLQRSPLLSEGELVDLAATVDARAQIAIASRPDLSRAVCAALVEVGEVDACAALVENLSADILPTTFERIVARFGTHPLIRDLLLKRADLPIGCKHSLMMAVSTALVSFVNGTNILSPQRTEKMQFEAMEKGTLSLATQGSEKDMRPLVRYLKDNGKLNMQLVLRALFSRNVRFVEEALAELSEMPVTRVAWILSEPASMAFKALYIRAKLPASAYGLFRVAFAAAEEVGLVYDDENSAALSRRMIERVLTALEENMTIELEPFFAMLRRFHAEAVREEARVEVLKIAA